MKFRQTIKSQFGCQLPVIRQIPLVAQRSRSTIAINVCLRLYTSVSKIQRPANPHGCWSGVYDFNDLFTTLIGQNSALRMPCPLFNGHALCKIARFVWSHNFATRSERPPNQDLDLASPKRHFMPSKVSHSTVTDFARFLGLSTSVPRAHAVWYASNCSGTTCSMGLKGP